MKNKVFRVLLIFTYVFIVSVVNAQNKFSLSGEITDSKTGESLVGVTVFNVDNKLGTVTNASGKYSIELPEGNHRISFNFIGYENTKKRISISKNTTLNIQLTSSSKAIDEVKVETETPDHNFKSTEVSVEKMSIAEVERIPVIMGDIMKTIQLLPGITSVAEGESVYIVRGSGFDQNLILMDDMPIYYSSHMQGLFSVFNSDAVDGLTVYSVVSSPFTITRLKNGTSYYFKVTAWNRTKVILSEEVSAAVK